MSNNEINQEKIDTLSQKNINNDNKDEKESKTIISPCPLTNNSNSSNTTNNSHEFQPNIYPNFIQQNNCNENMKQINPFIIGSDSHVSYPTNFSMNYSANHFNALQVDNKTFTKQCSGSELSDDVIRPPLMNSYQNLVYNQNCKSKSIVPNQLNCKFLF